MAGDQKQIRSRIKTCVQCGSILRERLQEEFAEVPDDFSAPYPEVDHCLACVLPIEGVYKPVVVTGFEPKSDKVQWVAALHETCEPPDALRHWFDRGLQAA